MLIMIIGSIIASLAGLALFIYFYRRGQFDNDEDVKYQLFREDENIDNNSPYAK